MKKLFIVAFLVLGCTDPTAPTIDCQGSLEVDVHITRFGSDTTVACVFPEPPVEPPCDDDNEDHHYHRHHHHRGHR